MRLYTAQKIIFVPRELVSLIPKKNAVDRINFNTAAFYNYLYFLYPKLLL